MKHFKVDGSDKLRKVVESDIDPNFVAIKWKDLVEVLEDNGIELEFGPLGKELAEKAFELFDI